LRNNALHVKITNGSMGKKRIGRRAANERNPQISGKEGFWTVSERAIFWNLKRDGDSRIRKRKGEVQEKNNLGRG